MQIIEFVGLPGCGKSTVIEEAMQNTNRRFVFRDELLKFQIPKTWRKQVWLRLFLKSVLLWHYLASPDMPQKRKYYSRLVDFLLRLYYFRETSGDSELLLEEGVIQYFSSLAYDDNLFVGVCLRRFINRLFHDFDITVVNCMLLVDESARRIQKRKKPGDRYDIEDEKRQAYLLTKKQETINNLLTLFPGRIYTMDMTRNLEENAKLLTEILGENS